MEESPTGNSGERIYKRKWKLIFELISSPCGVAVDSSGNVYFSVVSHRILKFDTKGIISIFAGNGNEGYDGDGGPAINAKLNDPFEVAVDSDAYGYSAETTNNVVRIVDMKGVISTIAGHGNKGYDGDGGPAINAKLNDPYEVQVGSVPGRERV